MSVAGDPQALRHIVIVGGGTAGWMTAAAVSRLTGIGTKVTLIESDAIGTVGVGEATIPSLLDFNAAIGIDEQAFMSATQGTFKLGIEFAGWGAIGERYMHPFGAVGRSALGTSFHQIWLRQHLLARSDTDPGALDDYAISTAAARRGRFAKPSANSEAVLSGIAYAYHLDAALYARFLRSHAEQRGVQRVEGRVVEVEQRSMDGFIDAVCLEDGRRFAADLFVDCSGFGALLLGRAMGVACRDWRHWLPCDRAVAIPTAKVGDPAPFTQATAEQAGWRWRIPLQHRTGNGHVYSSAFIDDATASTTLVGNLDAPPLADPRILRFTAGRREQLWSGNCVAIGLSAAFVEPLESTSIHLIQSGIARLMALLPDRTFSQVEIDEYNRLMIEEIEHVRDFVILHYHATRRDDSEFWNHCRTMPLPDSLASRIALWREKGRIFPAQNSLFSDKSWIAVLLGQGIVPRRADPLVAMLPVEETTRFLAHLRTTIARAAEAMPSHADYLARNCAAPAD